MITTDRPVCARRYAKCGGKKGRAWVPALLPGGGCLLCCYETGRGRGKILVSSCRTGQCLSRSPAQSRSCFKPEHRTEVLQQRGLLSFLLERCRGGTIFTKCESRPVEAGLLRDTHKPRAQSAVDISQLRSPSEAK